AVAREVGERQQPPALDVEPATMLARVLDDDVAQKPRRRPWREAHSKEQAQQQGAGMGGSESLERVRQPLSTCDEAGVAYEREEDHLLLAARVGEELVEPSCPIGVRTGKQPVRRRGAVRVGADAARREADEDLRRDGG